MAYQAYRVGRSRVQLRVINERRSLVRETSRGLNGPFVERGFAIEGREARSGSEMQSLMNDLEAELLRRGDVHVEDLDANIPTGYYRLEKQAPYRHSGGAVGQRRYAIAAYRMEQPRLLVYQAEDHDVHHLGSVDDADAEEGKKLSVTPAVAAKKVLKVGSSLLLYHRFDDVADTRFSSLVDDAGEAVDAAGGAGVITKVAQKFVSVATEFWQRGDFKVTGLGGSPTVTVRIETDSAGSPSGVLAHALLQKTGVVLSTGENAVSFDFGARLAAATYWLVVTATQGSYSQRGTTTGTSDQCKVFKDGAWSLAATVENMYFRIVGEAFPKFLDLSGLGNDAEMQSGIRYGDVAGKIGSGVEFDGVQGHLVVTQNATLSPTKAVTVECWLNADVKDSSLRDVLKKAASYEIIVRTNNDIGFEVNGDAASDIDIPSADWATGSWQHVVGTYDKDKGVVAIYLNGVLKASRAFSAAIVQTGSDIFIGSADGLVRFFDGKLDEVRVGDRALTAAEVKKRYDDTVGGVRPANDYRAPLDEAFDTTDMVKHKWRIRAKPTVTATAILRVNTFNKDGGALNTGSAAVANAGKWDWYELMSILQANTRFFIIEVEDPTNVNPVELDVVEVMPA